MGTALSVLFCYIKKRFYSSMLAQLLFIILKSLQIKVMGNHQVRVRWTWRYRDVVLMKWFSFLDKE